MLAITLIVVIIISASAFAFYSSSMNSEINAMNQKISQLNGKISSQNSTISSQESQISNMKSNETNMSVIINILQEEVASTNGNYKETLLLFNQISQIYGIQMNVLAYNQTIVIPAHQLQHFFGPLGNPSYNTTIAVLTSFKHLSEGGYNNSTFFNLTLYVNQPEYGGFYQLWQPISESNFAIYFNNSGNVSETFNVTILEIWR
jgi:hypothetical protein